MGIFDKAKEELGEHTNLVDEGIAKAGDFVDDKTGDKYSAEIDKGEAFADQRADDYLAPDADQPPA